jgi:hypothetical protein
VDLPLEEKKEGNGRRTYPLADERRSPGCDIRRVDRQTEHKQSELYLSQKEKSMENNDEDPQRQ